jgi:hypothetical protein
MVLATTVGPVQIETVYGQDPDSGQWLNPMREVWGLSAQQTMSPVLEERLCFTATLSGSFEKASLLAGKWGSPVDDATIHSHVAKAGARAQAQACARVERALDVGTRAEVAAQARAEAPREAFSLMLDGWMIRERGAQWGLKPPETRAERVAWREMKSGIVFRLDQRAATRSGRSVVLEKFYVADRGDPEELGRRLYAEALRRGLNQARQVYVVADGAVWIWNLVEDRFGEAGGVLDFYHASGHLWSVAHALFGEGSPQARAWIEPLLHQLAHGEQARVLQTLEDLARLCRQFDQQRQETIRREAAYFQNHKDHLHYQQRQQEGCPKGSGAMESTCSQFQNRFKCTGQFWTLSGERHLLALELARRNDDWDEIWELKRVA